MRRIRSERLKKYWCLNSQRKLVLLSQYNSRLLFIVQYRQPVRLRSTCNLMIYFPGCRCAISLTDRTKPFTSWPLINTCIIFLKAGDRIANVNIFSSFKPINGDDPICILRRVGPYICMGFKCQFDTFITEVLLICRQNGSLELIIHTFLLTSSL